MSFKRSKADFERTLECVDEIISAMENIRDEYNSHYASDIESLVEELAEAEETIEDLRRTISQLESELANRE